MAETLTEKERQTIEHLKRAQELGSPLTEYATAFSWPRGKIRAESVIAIRKT